MASRGAGTLLTEFNAAYVAPGLMPGYQGHVPGVAFSFGSPYGPPRSSTSRSSGNAEKSHTAFRKGGHFPASLFPNPNQVLSDPCTRFNLDKSVARRSASSLRGFYQMTQQHREYYQDKTGMAPRVPYFVLPVREWERSILTPRPPLGPKKTWRLLRVSPENLRTYQTFPSGKRVSAQERQMRDCYFEFRA
uniref:Ciliary microtubule inner protein 2C n=1 Tax=Balaenoptera musculus TaxID=9771 RepID=A0A8C0D6Z3_BALMU